MITETAKPCLGIRSSQIDGEESADAYLLATSGQNKTMGNGTETEIGWRQWAADFVEPN
ncbi:hypothetical protein [Stieleria bergensis]